MVGIKDSRTIAILRRLYILELNKNTPPIQTKIMAKIVPALVKIKAQFI